MTGKSLRLRLLVLALLTTSGALVISGVGLVFLFERHVEQRVDAELETYVRQIAGNLAFAPGGDIVLARPPSDPRFDQPLSGLYWQVSDNAEGRSVRSRSLWDSKLALPADVLDATSVHRHLLPGPNRATLIVRERSVAYTTPNGKRSLRIAAAIDSSDIRAATWAFAGDLVPSLALLGLALLAAAWLQVRIGLQPLDAVRRGIWAIRSGRRQRLSLDYPEEVMPLAEEVNTLLETQDRTIARARTSAADLAHGLKTPLTVLCADARLLREHGETDVARNIEDLTETMRRHIERAIAQARHRPSRGLGTELAPLIARLATTIQRTRSDDSLSWEIEIPPDLLVGATPDDVAEIMGNLIENAAKWAKGRVRVSAGSEGTSVILQVDDDGPGIPESQRRAVQARGTRLDEAMSGSGLGLAIVGDVLEACEGSLTLAASPLGGLSAVVSLPAVPAGQPSDGPARGHHAERFGRSDPG